MLRLSVPIILFLFCAPASGQAFRTETGTAEFTSSVPLHEFTGTSEHLTGRIDLAEGTVDFYLDLETLDTGIGKRDKDMRNTLETDEYPFAEFFGHLVSPFDSTLASARDVTVRGTFKIHGVEREIKVDGTLQRVDGGLRATAGWTLNLKDYSIKPPSLLIIKVDEEIRIRIDALLTPETP